MNDSILIETYEYYIQQNTRKGARFASVTHNTKDFSLPQGNDKLPHPDFAAMFSRVKSLYSISLGDILNRIAPDLLRDVEFQESYHEEPRRLAEIGTCWIPDKVRGQSLAVPCPSPILCANCGANRCSIGSLTALALAVDAAVSGSSIESWLHDKLGRRGSE